MAQNAAADLKFKSRFLVDNIKDIAHDYGVASKVVYKGGRGVARGLKTAYNFARGRSYNSNITSENLRNISYAGFAYKGMSNKKARADFVVQNIVEAIDAGDIKGIKKALERLSHSRGNSLGGGITKELIRAMKNYNNIEGYGGQRIPPELIKHANNLRKNQRTSFVGKRKVTWGDRRERRRQLKRDRAFHSNVAATKADVAAHRQSLVDVSEQEEITSDAPENEALEATEQSKQKTTPTAESSTPSTSRGQTISTTARISGEYGDAAYATSIADSADYGVGPSYTVGSVTYRAGPAPNEADAGSSDMSESQKHFGAYLDNGGETAVVVMEDAPEFEPVV